ncbi:hypothetical protein AGMMS49938_03430 [Fibrobacterales bacterium]|nr:hypothetical protein AGMMS49938_03430 [Fibrobacterales bacterium]
MGALDIFLGVRNVIILTILLFFAQSFSEDFSAVRSEEHFNSSLLMQTRNSEYSAASSDEHSEQNGEEKNDLFEFKNFMLLPAMSYTEETGFMVGGVFVKFMGAEQHYDLLAMVSFKKQWLIHNNFAGKTEDGHFDWLIGFDVADWTTRYFRRGNDIDTGTYTKFTLKNARIPLTLNSDYFLPKSWGGLFSYGVELDGEAITFDYGENFTEIEPKKERAAFRVGIGYNLTYDSREKNDWTRRGALVQWRNIYFKPSGRGNPQEFTWRNIITAVYFPIPFLPEGAIALSSYLEDFDGAVPFDRLAQPDGLGQMRGLKKGWLADKSSWVLQSEIRTHLFWRFAGTLFYEAGKVGENLHSVWKNDFHSSIGIGGRFLVNKDLKTHIRGDLSLIDRKYYGMAITLREAF